MDKNELIEIIEKELIPNYLIIKKKLGKDEYYSSIRLSVIKELGLSYQDTLFIIDYLGDKNIRVSSKGSNEFDMCDNVDVYHSSIIKNPKPNNKENIIENIKKYRETNDKELLNKIIQDNIRLVNYIYFKEGYYLLGLDKDEIIQSGLIALMVAINSYDFDNGASFGTYAYRCIDSKMARCAILCSNLHSQDSELFRIINKIENSDEFNDNFDILDEIINIVSNDEKLSDSYNTRKLELRLLLEKYKDSLEELFESDEDYSNNGYIHSIFGEYKDSNDEYNSFYEEIDRKEARELFESIFEELKPSEVFALKDYFGWDDNTPKTCEEVGDNMHMTRQAVSSKNARTLNKIITNHKDKLKDYK
jgi:RNA polymerase sigma factor (sigma-70 family)